MKPQILFQSMTIFQFITRSEKLLFLAVLALVIAFMVATDTITQKGNFKFLNLTNASTGSYSDKKVTEVLAGGKVVTKNKNVDLNRHMYELTTVVKNEAKRQNIKLRIDNMMDYGLMAESSAKLSMFMMTAVNFTKEYSSFIDKTYIRINSEGCNTITALVNYDLRNGTCIEELGPLGDKIHKCIRGYSNSVRKLKTEDMLTIESSFCI